jgi:hypothetical protein
MSEEVGRVSYGRISRGWWDIDSTHKDVPLSKDAKTAAGKAVGMHPSPAQGFLLNQCCCTLL